MNEIKRIINAFERAQEQGIRCALATIVKVEGSSYRQIGARMLAEETGMLTGAISGGCLEGDALRKAQLAIAQQQNKLIVYDTTDDDDTAFGVQLGCNGIVHILFEPLPAAEDAAHPVGLLRQIDQQRIEAAISVVCAEDGGEHPGTVLLYRNDHAAGNADELLRKKLMAFSQHSLQKKSSSNDKCEYNGEKYFVLTEYLQPPVHLVIAGAGNDAQPLTEIASVAGWEITVIDGRPAHAAIQRFPKADRVIVAKPADVLSKIKTDPETAFVLMTHNYNYDLALLKEVVKTNCFFIGILGPKKKYQRMLADLESEGIFLTPEQLHIIHAPVGLDLGAETPEEIALSVAAEIKAAFSGRNGQSLKEKSTAIHAGEG